MSGKYSQRLLGHAKKPATDALKTTSKRVIEKAAEATGDLIGNKLIDRITKVAKTSIQKSLEIVKWMIKKYLKVDIYLQKKGRKLLMIWD